MDRSQLYYLIPCAIVLATGISMCIIPIIIRTMKKMNLLDKPNERSSHTMPTPSMGGIAVIFGFVAVTFVFAYELPHSLYLLMAIGIVFICGTMDDLTDLSPLLKLGLEFVAAFLVCFSGIRLMGFHGLFGINEIPVFLQYVITMFLMVGITNAFNLIDGIDGLAGGIGLINAVLLGVLFLGSDRLEFAVISFTLAGALLGFLYYNFNPASIFMGDSGSLPIGFIFAILGMELIETNIVLHGELVSSHSLCLMSVGIVFLPVFDFIRVTVYRLTKKRSPFKADKNHLHHLLVKLGFNHKQSTVILYITNISLIALAFLMRDFWIEASMGLLFIIAYLALEFLSIKKIKNISGEMDKIEMDKTIMTNKNKLLND